MYERTLTGNLYVVHVRIREESHKEYSRGDHYGGDGEYTVSYGKGEATVCNHTGQTVAVCGLSYGCTDSSGYLRAVNDAAFKRCVEVNGLLPDREAAYADWFAEKITKAFRSPNRGGGMPTINLAEPDQAELIEHGFILDADGQARLPLYDTVAQ